MLMGRRKETLIRIVTMPSWIYSVKELSRLVRGLKTYSYSERLRYLGLPSLELRRLHLDLIFCYKIVFGIINVSFSSFFKFSTVTNTRGHQYKLYKSHCSHTTRSRFFAERIRNVWNCLPPSVDYSTLATFRRSIDGIDFTSSLKCDTDWVLSDIIGQTVFYCIALYCTILFLGTC